MDRLTGNVSQHPDGQVAPNHVVEENIHQKLRTTEAAVITANQQLPGDVICQEHVRKTAYYETALVILENTRLIYYEGRRS